MKKLVLFGFLFCIVLACEDTKKATVKKNTKTPIDSTYLKESTDSIKTMLEIKEGSNIVSEKVIISKIKKISQENVVAFLSEYGINNPETKVRISTLHGNIDIELFKDTPLHRANFIFLVKQEYFNNTFFHRVVSNFIIQGGNSDNKSTSQKRKNIGSKYFLPPEISTSRIHQYGTISGAKEYRENPDKMSAPFEFFIFLGPLESTRHLNGNYSIFGKVINGMDVVEKIANLPADKGDWPLVNVYITAEIIE